MKRPAATATAQNHGSSPRAQPARPAVRRAATALGLLAAIAASTLATGSAGAVPDLREAAADPALADAVRPQADELRWMEIDWQTDLWQARRAAYDEGKPIFLWQMDGHPLGCV